MRRVRDYQARLSIKLEPMKRKLLDNLVSLTGAPTDCIRVTPEKNDEGDINYNKVKEATIDSVIFPAIKEIPFRRIFKDDKVGYKISMVESASENAYDAYELVLPYESNIDVGDLIIRVFQDPNNIGPTVLVLQVSELKGTFGENMLLKTRVNCTLFTEQLRPEALKIISEMARRRLHLKF